MEKAHPSIIAAALVVAFTDLAHAYSFSRQAEAGKRTLMWQYGNWKADCSPDGGVVKVLSKPQHGKLTPTREMITIARSRWSPGSKCIGRRMPGFGVYYMSVPGFRGTDSFKIEVTYPGFPADVDTFTVQVR